MPAHGYLIYMIRAGVILRPHELYRLNEVGPQRADLLAKLGGQLNGLGKAYHAVEKNAEGFRIRELALRGRTLWVKIHLGPAGSPGETYDLDTGTSADTTDRQAQLSGLRALFVLPENSYYGLLFVERIGRRNLRDLLNQVAIRPTVDSANAVVRLEGFAELADWQREMQDMQVLRVSETFVKHDSGDDASTATDTLMSVSAEGGLVQQASDAIKNVFSNRIQRRDRRHELLQRSSLFGERRREADADGVTFQDEAEYQSIRDQLAELNIPPVHDDALDKIVNEVLDIDRDALEHRRFEFGLGEERLKRNIVIERDTIPQFVYELGARLSDGALRDTWVQHAAGILKARGVELLEGWDGGPNATISSSGGD